MPVKTDVFRDYPVKKAVLLQIIPAVAGQMIALVYNLADTYFVGMLDSPVATAAVTVAYPGVLVLTALSNLFGIGGAALIAKQLGKNEFATAKRISSISFWGGVGIGVAFSLVYALFSTSLLQMCGAKADTLQDSYLYAKWVVVYGGPFAVCNILLGNIVRSEGSSIHAAVGVSLGGILNMVLDPFFVLPGFLGYRAEGAGMATAISNMVATGYFMGYLAFKRQNTVLSLRFSALKWTKKYIGGIFSIGLPSAIQLVLTVVSIAMQARFVSNYEITEAVAALGIAKKLDQLPLYFSLGVVSGLLPLLAYNHSSGNIRRREQSLHFCMMISVVFSTLCLVVYEIFAPQLVSSFINEEKTVRYGTDFLRIMVVAMPMMAFCHPLITMFQAIGKVKEALFCSILRKGVLDIPLLFLLDSLFALYGCMFVQPIVDFISLLVALVLYRKIRRSEKKRG